MPISFLLYPQVKCTTIFHKFYKLLIERAVIGGYIEEGNSRKRRDENK